MLAVTGRTFRQRKGHLLVHNVSLGETGDRFTLSASPNQRPQSWFPNDLEGRFGLCPYFQRRRIEKSQTQRKGLPDRNDDLLHFSQGQDANVHCLVANGHGVFPLLQCYVQGEEILCSFQESLFVQDLALINVSLREHLQRPRSRHIDMTETTELWLMSHVVDNSRLVCIGRDGNIS
jgi:hypothetical protein